MRHLYEVQSMSLREVAMATGRPRSTVRWHLATAGVEMRPPYLPVRPCRRISYEQEVRTVALYASGLSMRQVGVEVGASTNAVRERLRAAGVQARTQVDGHARRMAEGFIDAETNDLLVRLYRDERLSMKQVGERAGVTPETVRRALRRRGEPVRSLADATRIDRARRAGRDVMAVSIQGVEVAKMHNVLRRPDARNAVGFGRGSGMSPERERKYVPSAPLALAVLGQARMTPTELANAAGIDGKVLRNWRTGEQRRATWGSADAVLVALDRFWWEVFDPQDGPHGAFSGVRSRDVVAWVAAAEAAIALWEPDEADGEAVEWLAMVGAL